MRFSRGARKSGILSQPYLASCEEYPSHLISPVCCHLDPVDLDPKLAGGGRWAERTVWSFSLQRSRSARVPEAESSGAWPQTAAGLQWNTSSAICCVILGKLAHLSGPVSSFSNWLSKGYFRVAGRIKWGKRCKHSGRAWHTGRLQEMSIWNNKQKLHIAGGGSPLRFEPSVLLQCFLI
jgi:hypothetical protein